MGDLAGFNPSVQAVSDDPIKFAAISAANSADLVAAVSTKKIRVLALALTVASDVTIKFQSGASTDLTGAMSPGAKAPLVLPESPNGWFQTVAGEKLNIVLSGASTLSGFLKYQEVED